MEVIPYLTLSTPSINIKGIGDGWQEKMIRKK